MIRLRSSVVVWWRSSFEEATFRTRFSQGLRSNFWIGRRSFWFRKTRQLARAVRLKG